MRLPSLTRALRRLAVPSLCLALTVPMACAHPPVARPEAGAEPVPIAAPRLGELDLEGAWRLQANVPAFGGISAARISGDRLLLLSDRSRLFELGWREPPVAERWTAPLLGQRTLTAPGGEPLDAEALSVLPSGRLLVADEATGRLLSFAKGAESSTTQAPTIAGFGPSLGVNEGLEALDRLPDGSMLILREGEDGEPGRHRAARLDGEGKQELRYRSSPGFKPTDLAVAGAWLFVLERRVSLLGGWQTRIVAVALDRLPAHEGGLIEGHELARLSGSSLSENYEALTVLPEPWGFRLLIVSDDNFSPFQETLLLMFAWRADAGPRLAQPGL